MFYYQALNRFSASAAREAAAILWRVARARARYAFPWKDIADLYAANAGVGNRRSVLRWIKIGVCAGSSYLQIDVTYLRAHDQTGTNFNGMKIIPDLRPRCPGQRAGRAFTSPFRKSLYLPDLCCRHCPAFNDVRSSPIPKQFQIICTYGFYSSRERIAALIYVCVFLVEFVRGHYSFECRRLPAFPSLPRRRRFILLLTISFSRRFVCSEMRRDVCAGSERGIPRGPPWFNCPAVF